MKHKNVDGYAISLDIGTNSVGYAVTTNDGEMIRFNGKNMMGVRLVEDAQTAAKTRSFRSLRRRYLRRKNRIFLLQSLMQNMVLEKDKNFFMRLSESSLHWDDRSTEINDIKSSLFSGDTFKDKEFYRQYKTIYHLRYELMTNDRKYDPRLIYLAIHHIIKYRGNFLYEGELNSDSIPGKNKISRIFSLLNDSIDETTKGLYFNTITDDVINKIESTLLKNISKKIKQKELEDILKEYANDSKKCSELIKLILGYSSDFTKIVDEDLKSLSGENIKIHLSKVEDISVEIEKAPEYEDIIYASKDLYDWILLNNILNGKGSISEAMICKYKKFGYDRKLLKEVIYSYNNKKQFEEYFKSTKNESCILDNYTSRTEKSKKLKKEDFYGKIKKTIEANKKTEYTKDEKYILAEIENDSFLEMLRISGNGVIPYQLHNNELKMILKNQSKYYRELEENMDKILSIHTFRIPYYIGPLSKEETRFNWAVRKNNDKLYPWNFYDVIDKEKSAEKFILRMTNKCTYLHKENVLPKKSLIYSMYELLNELNKVKVNGKNIFKDKLLKKEVIDDVFKNPKNKKVTVEKLKSFLSIRGINVKTIDGLSKDTEFSSNLESYIDFTKIGLIDNFEDVEKIIKWITIFTEKDILKEKIRKEMPYITERQIDSIMKFNYSGWGRLSRKLLYEMYSEDENGEIVTIFDLLKETNLNFMQIISSSKYSFKEQIEGDNQIIINDDFDYEEHVSKLQTSPAFKRVIWRSLQIVEEITNIMGKSPTSIFLEVAKADEKSKITQSRKSSLKKNYDKIKDDNVDNIKELKKYLENNKNDFSNEKFYLYFLQLGKCAYSGQSLNIDELSNYEVDHILPRSIIKDDSLENKVLVIGKENQKKAGNLTLDYDLIVRRKPEWKRLKDLGLMGDKKYFNLCRENFSDSDIEGFIERQIVGTRQITKEVIRLLKNKYNDSNVYSIKAKMARDFREKYSLFKSRNINDFHHAHDALINGLIGRYIVTSYPNYEGEINSSEKSKYFYLKYKNLVKDRHDHKFGFFVSNMSKDENFNEEFEIGRLKKYMSYSDIIVTKDKIENDGEFYNQSINKKSDSAKLVHLKKETINGKLMEVSKYGGYTNANPSYCVVISYDKVMKKGTIKEYSLVSIPIYIAYLERTRKNSIINYIREKYANPQIIKDKIKVGQEVEVKGANVYLMSDSEWNNAVQLSLSKEVYDFISSLEKSTYEEINTDIIEKMISKSVVEILEKMKRFYPVYNNVLLTLESIYKYDFTSLPINSKIQFILEILKITKSGAGTADLSKVREDFSKRVGRLGGKNLNIKETIFIDYSVSGLFCKKTKLV